MNFKEYLAEKALNDKVYASTIERLGGTAKMGFELEMWIPEESDLLIIDDGDSSKGDYGKTAAEAKKSLEDALGVDVTINGDDINDWRIVPDGSIQEGGTGTGIELVSPPTPVDDALGDLKQCFKWMTKHEVVTNSTTGLHLNLSIPGLAGNLDPLKLILFMGEAHVLKSYERETNTYAKKHYTDLVDAIKNMGVLPKSLNYLTIEARKSLKKEKYRTVNLSKLDHGYLEFRTAGNENYHKKYNQVAGDVGRFLTVLEIACDPDAERQEYLKKIAKLFGDAKETAKIDRSKTRNLSNEPSPEGSLESIIGDVNLFSLKELVKNGESSKIVQRLSRVMKLTGADLSDGKIDVSPKNIAEFKLLLSKLAKIEPEALSKAKASASSQVELDDIKAFMKAFNLK